MEAGGGGAPLCCLLCHCSPPTPCLPPPPRVCPPGAPRGGEVGAGGGGGCCAHWETFRNWENSAGVVPPPPLPVCPLQPGVGGGRRAVSPAGSSGVGGTADQWSTSSPWSGWVLCPPPPPPPLGQTPRQPGEHQPVGVTIFFWGGMTGDGGTGPGCIQPPQGGGRQSWVSPPPPLGGVALNPPTDSGATVPTLGTFAVELQPWPFPAGSSGWWGGGGRGGQGT